LININVDGKNYEVLENQTVLSACRSVGADIPTLCHDDRLTPYGGCLMCRVEIEGARGNPLSCSSMVTDGMVIGTRSKALTKQRKTAVELMLSDHHGDCVAPCSMACPAHIDIQGYIAHIANGDFEEALALIKKQNPLPVVCGRICTRQCEDQCRRRLVDEAIGIDYLKRFVADLDVAQETPYLPGIGLKTGKKVAVIGAGPSGLSAAWFLAEQGHEVTIFEKRPEAGGMLRYGIPAFRLPRNMLDKEIKTIESLGVTIKYGVYFGLDVTWKSLKNEGFGAVYLGVGSQRGVGIGVPDEDKLPRILRGIDFMGLVGLGKNPDLNGKRIMVVGGGNTAADAARTAVRLGAKEVWMVYRRTKAEMPAHRIEVTEAAFEGVKIVTLVTPAKVQLAPDGSLDVTMQHMDIGQADKNGRRQTILIEGAKYKQQVDFIIAAAGQTQDLSFVSEDFALGVEGNKIVIDEELMTTNIQGVFAGGDVVTGPQTAIKAIAAGHRAAISIDRYLSGEKLTKPKAKYCHVKAPSIFGVDKGEYKNVVTKDKNEMPELGYLEREHNFNEVELGYSQQQAVDEASRCLGCGCKDNAECKLREYATEYECSQSAYSGENKKHFIDFSHPYIVRDANKCISCTRCVRICTEVQGVGSLGIVGRGFDTQIEPSFGVPFGEEKSCIRCGQCVSACPVGALTEKTELNKAGPFDETVTDAVCSFCGAGCVLELRTVGGKLVRVTSDTKKGHNGGNLCERGRFKHGYIASENRLKTAIVGGKKTDIDSAIAVASVALKNARGSSAVYIGGRSCTEECDYLSGLASFLGTKQISSFGVRYEAAAAYLRFGDVMVKSFGELQKADLFLNMGLEVLKGTSNVQTLIRRKIRQGTSMAEITGMGKIVELMMKSGQAPVVLFGANPNLADAQAIAKACEGTACKIFVPSGRCNSRGVGEILNLSCPVIPDGKVDTVIIYGEDPVGCGDERARRLIGDATLVIAFDQFETETTKCAHIVLPLGSFAETGGTYVSQFGAKQSFQKAISGGMDSLALLKTLADKVGFEAKKSVFENLEIAQSADCGYYADCIEAMTSETTG